ncbi:hypothetical protein ADUPG1_014130 [Aduncisulcus paluster]|uniref:Acyltransferase 3 domain-containing protein n=1 Tax=Aduncisulcus paluster TaxID=2918883 RepID=A0ABQ5KEK0_9EUKA|nr:hypothetical protein ADUPG1_014130 [Aduncisulcus paluster]
MSKNVFAHIVQSVKGVFSPPPGRSALAHLDGYRALLTCCVMSAHWVIDYKMMFPQTVDLFNKVVNSKFVISGWIVDVFFFLSGFFTIQSLWRRTKFGQTPSVKDVSIFVFRRALRLWPAVIVPIIDALISMRFGLLSTDKKPMTLLLHVLFVSCWVSWEWCLAGHLWSNSVEVWLAMAAPYVVSIIFTIYHYFHHRDSKKTETKSSDVASVVPDVTQTDKVIKTSESDVKSDQTVEKTNDFELPTTKTLIPKVNLSPLPPTTPKPFSKGFFIALLVFIIPLFLITGPGFHYLSAMTTRVFPKEEGAEISQFARSMIYCWPICGRLAQYILGMGGWLVFNEIKNRRQVKMLERIKQAEEKGIAERDHILEIERKEREEEEEKEKGKNDTEKEKLHILPVIPLEQKHSIRRKLALLLYKTSIINASNTKPSIIFRIFGDLFISLSFFNSLKLRKWVSNWSFPSIPMYLRKIAEILGRPLTAFPYELIILFASLDYSLILNFLMRYSPMSVIGRLSFSLYVTHFFGEKVIWKLQPLERLEEWFSFSTTKLGTWVYSTPIAAFLLTWILMFLIDFIIALINFMVFEQGLGYFLQNMFKKFIKEIEKKSKGTEKGSIRYFIIGTTGGIIVLGVVVALIIHFAEFNPGDNGQVFFV